MRRLYEECKSLNRRESMETSNISIHRTEYNLSEWGINIEKKGALSTNVKIQEDKNIMSSTETLYYW